MEKFVVQGNQKSPSINFDLLQGTLTIEGQSVLENTAEFYEPLLQAIDVYATAVKPSTVININLEYFNTSSQKLLLNIFRKFEVIHRNGNAVNVNWNYLWDDEDMLEAGDNYQAILTIPFNMVKILE